MSSEQLKVTIKPKISVFGIIELEIPNVFPLISRAINTWGRTKVDIVISGDTDTGKSWFVGAAKGEDLRSIGLTFGSQEKDVLFSPSGKVTNSIEFTVHDIGGQEVEWLDDGLRSAETALAVLFFVDYRDEKAEGTKLHLNTLVKILQRQEIEYKTLASNIKVLIPVVSRADEWSKDLDELERTRFRDALQKRFSDEFKLLAEILGTKFYSEIVMCSAVANDGSVRKVFEILMAKL
jgi:hypothetical protein